MPSTIKNPKWHLLYYILGAIDIIAVCSSLHLNTVITEKYEQAILTNEFWSKLRHEMRLLESSASKLNAPGNDVFASRDIEKERSRFQEAAAAFDSRFRAFRLMVTMDGRSKSSEILGKIDNVHYEAAEMTVYTENIFTALRDGNVEKAASFMALLDQEFSELRDHTNELAISFTKSQDLSLEEEQTRIKELRILDRSVSIFIVVMVLGVILYGRKITSFVNKSTQALIDAKEKAETAAKTKSSFLANMSHEIRTPLNGVVGNITLLQDTALTDDQSEMVETIRSSSDALLALIDDILDFSKIEAGKLQIEHRPFDIRRAIAEAVKIITPRAEEKTISIRVSVSDDVPNILISDYLRFRQVLLNLLSNAVKFTDKGHVSIYADAAKGPSDDFNLTVSIQDSGIGMTTEQQGKLFQEFSQVDASTTRKYGGTGLGLAICKHLCSLLGGKISVESTPGSGSTFSFTIAAKDGLGQEPVNVPRFSEAKGGRNMGDEHPLRILVAEDNKVNQTIAVKLLKKLKYEVDVVENGVRALEASRKIDYDVIFMDVHMPEMDGYEATQAIRSEKSSRKHPFIIALTASVMQSDKQLCFDSGMNDFLKKPLEISDLKATLQKFLSERSGGSIMTKSNDTVQVEGVNLPAILKKFDDDFAMFQTVAGVYLGDYQNYLDRIKASLEKNDAHELEESAHALKGAANNFSASLVTATAAKMEAFGHDGNIGAANRMFTQLNEEADLLRSKLSDFISARNAA